jgi:uncharacterized membrane protein
MINKIRTHKLYPVLLLALLITLLVYTVVYAANISSTDKWAWGSNVGWINFNPSHGGGVTVYENHLEGYAWGENIGWIRLGSDGGGDDSYYLNTTKDNYGVNRDASDDLSGYAWGTNIGWINFNPTHGGVTVYADHLEGYIWGENVGWIRLGTHTGGGTHTYANTDSTNYGVNNDGAGNLSGYAWGTNVGWINFNPTHGGATAYADHLEGYIWGENIGWIRLGSDGSNDGSYYPNITQDDYGVNFDNSTGQLSGYAWGTNVGWINFNPTDGGVTINTTTGDFSGYAWGENIGWIHVKGTAADGTDYCVLTNYFPTAVELVAFTATAAGDDILLEWETATELDNLGFNLYRSEEADEEGELSRLNAALIPGQNPGSPVGGSYAFVDQGVSPGVTYWYWLEAVDVHGAVTRHGPVSATVSTRPVHRIYLPMVGR